LVILLRGTMARTLIAPYCRRDTPGGAALATAWTSGSVQGNVVAYKLVHENRLVSQPIRESWAVSSFAFSATRSQPNKQRTHVSICWTTGKLSMTRDRRRRHRRWRGVDPDGPRCKATVINGRQGGKNIVQQQRDSGQIEISSVLCEPLDSKGRRIGQ
jgi:hypothetical protein